MLLQTPGNGKAEDVSLLPSMMTCGKTNPCGLLLSNFIIDMGHWISNPHRSLRSTVENLSEMKHVFLHLQPGSVFVSETFPAKCVHLAILTDSSTPECKYTIIPSS